MTDQASTLIVTAIGGATFAAELDGTDLGRFEAGSLDADGQWIEGEDDLDDAARAAFDLDESVAVELPF